MARRAIRDTFGVETIVGGIEVRRRVMAGDQVPDIYDVDSSDVEDFEPGPRRRGYNPDEITDRTDRRADNTEGTGEHEKKAASASRSKAKQK